MRTKPAAGVLVAGLVLSLASTLGLSSTAGAAADDRRADPSAAAAKQALTDAQALMAGSSARSDRDASMVLRDLFLRADQLSGSDAKAARAILSRPTDPGDDDYYGAGVTVERACGVYVCVHWVESGEEASDPDFAAATLETMDDVHELFVNAGYRAPILDAGQGGSTQTDIYLANMGDKGYYGYCTTDVDEEGQPDWVDGWTVAPYCALDNDFSAEEFPTNTPLENMQVTAAHEYFHAVQFAYDANDDSWIYETTATWAEDEAFDDINDNWNYLPYGQLGDPNASEGFPGEGPGVSLDLADFPYGNWIFFRYLTEKFTDKQGSMPTLVLDVWNELDTTGGKSDTYSLAAVISALADRGTSMKSEYAQFSLENNTPGLTYDEGADYPYPAYAFNPVSLSKGEKSASKIVKLDHLTSGTGAFVPFANGYKLKVKVDMTDAKTGSMAAVAVYNLNGDLDRSWIKLNKKGKGAKKVAFASDKVAYVEVTLVNASTQMVKCGQDPDWRFSCGGFGKYENQKQKVSVKAVK